MCLVYSISWQTTATVHIITIWPRWNCNRNLGLIYGSPNDLGGRETLTVCGESFGHWLRSNSLLFDSFSRGQKAVVAYQLGAGFPHMSLPGVRQSACQFATPARSQNKPIFNISCLLDYIKGQCLSRNRRRGTLFKMAANDCSWHFQRNQISPRFLLWGSRSTICHSYVFFAFLILASSTLSPPSTSQLYGVLLEA